MGRKTGIEWTDSTWNPIRGCSRVSEGCRNCYAEATAARFSGPGMPYEGLASFRVIGEGKPEERVESHWTGKVQLIEKHLYDPLHWREPRRIFVNSMSDLFHEEVSDQWINRIFSVMARAPQHTYQILTKRPLRMQAVLQFIAKSDIELWPPKNWWFGVSIEDQDSANERLPILADTGVNYSSMRSGMVIERDQFAMVSFVSYEPALGPVNWYEAMPLQIQRCMIDWIIVGGESGPRARPMNPEWARATRLFCSDYEIPFFFKQWGEFTPNVFGINDSFPPTRVGKKAAGASLDGREYKEFPKC